VTRGLFDAELVAPPVKWLLQHAKPKYKKNLLVLMKLYTSGENKNLPADSLNA